MKTIMTTVALAALLAAAPAVAQTAAQPTQTQEMQNTAGCTAGATQTADGTPCPADSSAAAPAMPSQDSAAAPLSEEPANAAAATQPTESDSTTTGSLPSTGGTGTAQSDATQPGATDMVAEQERGKFIDEQSDDTVLASELIGLTVYNPADEALGDVNDVAWKEDGSVDAVIVGVGGFLGIGEKEVAVAYEAIEITTDENGGKKLVLNATADELAAAPEFMTSAEKTAMLQSQQEQAAPPATGGGMAPAPAAPEPAPAQ